MNGQRGRIVEVGLILAAAGIAALAAVAAIQGFRDDRAGDAQAFVDPTSWGLLVASLLLVELARLAGLLRQPK